MAGNRPPGPTDSDREHYATLLFEAASAGNLDDTEYSRRLALLSTATTVAGMAAIVDGGAAALERSTPPSNGSAAAASSNGFVALGAPGATTDGGKPERELDPVDLALLLRQPSKGKAAAGTSRYKALIWVSVAFGILIVMGVVLALLVHTPSSGSSPTGSGMELARGLAAHLL